jgi:hypothetical protein
MLHVKVHAPLAHIPPVPLAGVGHVRMSWPVPVALQVRNTVADMQSAAPGVHTREDDEQDPSAHVSPAGQAAFV